MVMCTTEMPLTIELVNDQLKVWEYKWVQTVGCQICATPKCSSSWNGIFVRISFSGLASVGPVGITNILNPVVLPDLELGFHKLDCQWHFLRARDCYVLVLDIASDISLDICKDIVIDIAQDIVIDIARNVAYDNAMRYLL